MKSSGVNGTDGLIASTNGYSAYRYDVTGVSANPGSTNSIWADSGNSNSLRYGSGNILVDPAPTIANAIPVYTGVAGQVDTLTTTTAATLSRPVTISAGATTIASTFNTTDANCFVNISTTGTTSNRGAVTFGRSAVGQWTIGSDKDNSNADNFFIFRNGSQSLVIYASDQLLTANYGVTTKRYDLTAVAANPGSTNTLWLNSATSGLVFNSGNIMSCVTPVNLAIPVFTGTAGFTSTATGIVAATLSRPLSITPPSSVATLSALTVNGQATTAGSSSVQVAFTNSATTNCSSTVVIGAPQATSSKTWIVGNDKLMSNGDDFYVYRNSNNTYPLIIDSSNVVHTLAESAPSINVTRGGGAAVDTLTRDSFGNLLDNTDYVLTTGNKNSLLNQTYSGTWTMSSPTMSTSSNISVSALRIGNSVTAKIAPFTVSPNVATLTVVKLIDLVNKYPGLNFTIPLAPPSMNYW